MGPRTIWNWGCLNGKKCSAHGCVPSYPHCSAVTSFICWPLWCLLCLLLFAAAVCFRLLLHIKKMKNADNLTPHPPVTSNKAYGFSTEFTRLFSFSLCFISCMALVLISCGRIGSTLPLCFTEQAKEIQTGWDFNASSWTNIWWTLLAYSVDTDNIHWTRAQRLNGKLFECLFLAFVVQTTLTLNRSQKRKICSVFWCHLVVKWW